MWRSSKGLLRKLAVTLKVGSGVVVSVRQRPMSTVMAFGCSWDGALGLPNRDRGTEEIAYKPTPIPSLPSDIVSIHAGPRNSFAVTSQGQLWSWGTNQYAVPFRDVNYWQTSNEPLEIWELENVNVCTAFASHRVSGVVGDDGSVWVWGRSKQGQLGLGEHITEAVVPFRVEALSGENVAKVSLGMDHALALTVDGKLFRWGYSVEHAIGMCGSIWEPCLFEELCGIQVLDIACGYDNSFIICRDGTLLSCGENSNGHLGRGIYGEERELDLVEMSCRFVSVAVGPCHSLAICQLDESNGANVGTTKIASWGFNRHGALGRLDYDGFPGLIDGLDGENPVSVSAGGSHSLALTSKGKLWVWGSGSNGALGFKSHQKHYEPYYLDSLEGFQILQVVAGYDHNLVLVAD